MTTDSKSLASYATPELAVLCAQQSSCANSADIEPHACYELFRRACDPPFDDVAWQSGHTQYERLVQYWLGQYTSDDTVQDTFFRFFQAQKTSLSSFTARYADISAVTAYLKRCAITARIAAWRVERRQSDLEAKIVEAYTASPVHPDDPSSDQTHAVATLKALVRVRLKDDLEQLVFELTYVDDLTPREIQARYPDRFSTVQAVYRVRENLLKRLRRDAELQDWWNNG